LAWSFSLVVFVAGLDSKTAWGYSLVMSKFIQSASSLSSCPPTRGVEVAFLGRSNAGKSSLINTLLGAQLAKTSSKPGHTQLLNFFEDTRRGLVLVDMPGYGYAARGNAETQKWQIFIEDYLRSRENLRAAVLVMDIRRDWAGDEDDLIYWISVHRSLPLVLALTKTDKLNQKELAQRLRYFEGLKLPMTLCPVSSQQPDGAKKLGQVLSQGFDKP